jgi:16S rRNA processing protein RimM
MIDMTLTGIRVAGSAFVAKVETDDEEQIASVRKASLIISPEERFQLPEDEYYMDDLVGLIVKDKEGSVIGRLSDILETPANDIYEVLDGEGREILLPAIEDVILKIDIKGGEITADISNLI